MAPHARRLSPHVPAPRRSFWLTPLRVCLGVLVSAPCFLRECVLVSVPCFHTLERVCLAHSESVLLMCSLGTGSKAQTPIDRGGGMESRLGAMRMSNRICWSKSTSSFL